MNGFEKQLESCTPLTAEAVSKLEGKPRFFVPSSTGLRECKSEWQVGDRCLAAQIDLPNGRNIFLFPDTLLGVLGSFFTSSTDVGSSIPLLALR